jgi:hypothetical protein
MTLQSSGPISLANVQTEFGGSNPIGINEYYGRAAGIPGSGTISLYDFYGKSSFAWTTDIMGSSLGDGSNSPHSYNGNIVTPGSGFSPANLVIDSTTDSGGSFSIYIGGSLAYTFSNSQTNTSHTSSFGSSTYQFRSTMVDLTSNDSPKILTVFVGATRVYYHSQDFYIND